MRIATLAWIAFLSIGFSGQAARPKEAPYSWPAFSGPEAIQAAVKMKSGSGLVVLERKCKVQLQSWGVSPFLIRKEEFLRFLVLNEEGARNANIDLLMDEGAHITLVEGRTISPIGEITALDRERDVTIVSVKRKKDSFRIDIGGVAKFPAPGVGAVLDLHFISENTPDYGPYFYGQPLLYDLTTTMKAELEVRIAGGFPGKRWNMLSFGMGQGGCKLETLPNREGYAATMGPFQMEFREANAPPSYHMSPFVLCFIDFSDLDPKGDQGQPSQRLMTWDARGQVRGIEFPAGEPSTNWWKAYIEETMKRVREFLNGKGAAAQIHTEAIAPENLPLEERLRRYYAYVQDVVKRDPDAERIFYLSDVMKKGANSHWQGTLLYAFLLEKAKIPHKIGLVANRYAIRYSPIAKNGQLYDFDLAVIVEIQGAPPYVLQPGDFSMDFAELPFERQEALVFLPPENDSVKVFYSPVNSLDRDVISWSYDLEMDRSGAASGTVSLEKNGAPASEFRNWQTLREIHQRNPKIKDREKRSEQDRKKELESEVEKAFFIPGDQFTISGKELVKCELSCKTPIVFKARAEGKGIGQASGERWLIAANPLMLGFKSGYERALRTNPIWNSFAGRLLLEGELLLPPGAKVVKLPKPQEAMGPGGVVVHYTVEQVEREGRISLKSHMEYDFPLIVGSDFYASYKSYLDVVARLSQDRCIVEFPGEKALE